MSNRQIKTPRRKKRPEPRHGARVVRGGSFIGRSLCVGGCGRTVPIHQGECKHCRKKRIRAGVKRLKALERGIEVGGGDHDTKRH